MPGSQQERERERERKKKTSQVLGSDVCNKRPEKGGSTCVWLPAMALLVPKTAATAAAIAIARELWLSWITHLDNL